MALQNHRTMKCCRAGAGWLQRASTHVRQAGTCHKHMPKLQQPCAGPGCGQGEPHCRQGPGSIHPALGLCRTAPQGTVGFATSAPTPCSRGKLFPPCRGCPRLAPCLALPSTVLFKVQRVFLQCLNKRCFCGREIWFNSDGDGERSCGRLCQGHSQSLVHNACALPSTARSPLLSACRKREKLELIHAISVSGNIFCCNRY